MPATLAQAVRLGHCAPLKQAPHGSQTVNCRGSHLSRWNFSRDSRAPANSPSYSREFFEEPPHSPSGSARGTPYALLNVPPPHIHRNGRHCGPKTILFGELGLFEGNRTPKSG